ncbi:MAG TPA: class I adenylate-forming enzyme family protein, partial [Terriglobia bacterium]|nr:class I adenylate-forming enzyme family protein [Terriglobia bacterium]
METLTELLRDIGRLGNREAVRSSNGLRTRIATYSDLYGKIGAVVERFDRKGIHKGDRVLIWAENRLEWVAVFWACIARGIEAIPVDYRFSADLVQRIQSESRPRLVIDNAALDEIETMRPAPQFTPTEVAPDDIVEVVYTSGTTGEPKGVIHRHRNICANLRPFRKEIGKYLKWARPFQPVRILDLLPLSHMFGQSLGLFIPLFLQGSVVFTSEMHPGKIIDFIRANRISVLVCVPRILENLKNEVMRTSLPARDRRATAPGGGHWSRRLFRYRGIHSRFGWKFWAFVVGGARVD